MNYKIVPAQDNQPEPNTLELKFELNKTTGKPVLWARKAGDVSWFGIAEFNNLGMMEIDRFGYGRKLGILFSMPSNPNEPF